MEETLNILKDIKLVIDTAIVLVEHPGDGENKKKKVIEIVNDFIKSNNVVVPIPMMIFNYILGMVIDWTVKWLNSNMWNKDEKKLSK